MIPLERMVYGMRYLRGRFRGLSLGGIDREAIGEDRLNRRDSHGD